MTKQTSSKVVSFRVNPAELASLKAKADAAGMVIGEYARARSLGTSGTPSANYLTATNSRLEGLESQVQKLARQVARDLGGKESHGDAGK